MADPNNKMNCGWDSRQIRDFVNNAVKRHQDAWKLVPSLRTAILAEEYASIVSGQHVETISTERLSNLWALMLIEARRHGGE